MEILQGVWKQHLRPRAVVGYGVRIFLPSPPNYVTRSPGLRSGGGSLWFRQVFHVFFLVKIGISGNEIKLLLFLFKLPQQIARAD